MAGLRLLIKPSLLTEAPVVPLLLPLLLLVCHNACPSTSHTISFGAP